MLSPGLPWSTLNGHHVRREDSRGSLFMDPGTPDSVEVTIFLYQSLLLALVII